MLKLQIEATLLASGIKRKLTRLIKALIKNSQFKGLLLHGLAPPPLFPLAKGNR